MVVTRDVEVEPVAAGEASLKALEVRHGNEHETHLSGWTEEDFAGVPHLYKNVGFTFTVAIRDRRLAPIRFVPFSYFCTC